LRIFVTTVVSRASETAPATPGVTFDHVTVPPDQTPRTKMPAPPFKPYATRDPPGPSQTARTSIGLTSGSDAQAYPTPADAGIADHQSPTFVAA
jgi:hypothetical protein